MRYFLLLPLLLSTLVWAEEIIWLDQNWQPIASSKQATFYSYRPSGQDEQGRWPVTVYYHLPQAEKESFYFKGYYDHPDFWQATPIGEYESYYKTGELESKGRFNQQGELEGELRRYFKEDGTVTNVVNYSNGVKHGLAEYFNVDGRKYHDVHYQNGKKHGLSRRWYRGILKSEENYINDYLDGEYKKYNYEGNLQETGFYKQGKPTGIRKRYYDDGKSINNIVELDDQGRIVRHQSFDKDGSQVVLSVAKFSEGNSITDEKWFKQGTIIRRLQTDSSKKWKLIEGFNQSGELIERFELLNNQRHGLFINLLYGEESIERFSYQNGKQQGEYEQVFLTGESIVKGQYHDDTKVGKWQYFQDHKIRTEHYNSKGELNGELKEVTNNGQLTRLEHYQEGALHGEYLRYSESGKLYSKGLYINGKRDGDWIYSLDYKQNELWDELWIGTYDLGTKVGKWRMVTAQGYELGYGQYDAQGRPQGISYYFKENGLLKEVKRYQNGKQHGDTVHYLLGEPEYIKRYENGKYIETIQLKVYECLFEGLDC